jgi:glucose-1-phosphate cytidylyltransferase
MNKNIGVVILCGGKGIRMSEMRGFAPKPMVKIGDKPVLWHIMKIYSYYGFNNFVLCLGYRGNKIREYFEGNKEWNITFADTGLDTNTGGRIKRIEEYINDEVFLVTYADGLSNININDLLEYHRRQDKIATITVVKPRSPFGMLELDDNNLVASFKEKPVLDYWINGGFFVFHRDVFKYIEEGDTLEKEAFDRLLKDRELCAYKHDGFWKCMDTYKDNLELNEMWRLDKAQWAIWKERGL